MNTNSKLTAPIIAVAVAVATLAAAPSQASITAANWDVAPIAATTAIADDNDAIVTEVRFGGFKKFKKFGHHRSFGKKKFIGKKYGHGGFGKKKFFFKK